MKTILSTRKIPLLALTITASLLSSGIFSQTKALTKMKMTNATLTKTGKLKIVPSKTSSQNDFDFLEGKWKVQNRKLTTLFSNSDDWTTFESELHMRKALRGISNVENFYAELNGKPYEGMAIRLYNPQTKLWSVYWTDSNGGTMDEHPVTGSFENGVGRLYTKDSFNGKAIIVLYQWDATDPQHPKWSQALSDDNGKTWEWNWEMVLTRIA
ncbi:MAG: hypothetical protein V4722_00825 [Bacteroidota bacterium]